MSNSIPPNAAAVVAYLCMPITSGILLLLEKENREVLFHAWQATLFSGGAIVVMIVVKILTEVIGAIVPFLGTLIGLVRPLVLILWGVVMVVGLVKAYQGERWKLPYLGDIAERKSGVSTPPAG